MVERARRTSRIGAAMAALALQAMLGYAILVGLSVRLPAAISEEIRVFTVAPPPPPRPRAAGVRRQRTPGRAAAPTLAIEPLAIIAAPTIDALALPAIVQPPTDDAGGTTIGAGPGGGDAGGGGEGGDWTPSRWRRGEITSADYPRTAVAAGASGSLTTRYVVGTGGRVTECTVTRSSGSAELDATTCRLIRERFRFRPARDARGRAIPDFVTEDHVWRIDD